MRLRLVEKDGVAWQYISDYKEYQLELFDFSNKKGLDDLFAWDQEQTRKPFNIIENDLFLLCAVQGQRQRGRRLCPHAPPDLRRLVHGPAYQAACGLLHGL
jgi:hypothetical protein